MSFFYSDEQLKKLDILRIPQHIAMILDGNRRWARNGQTDVRNGHRAGADVLVDTVKAAKELGVRILTLYVFSTENWMRDKAEVTGLLWLLENMLKKQIPAMLEHQVKFSTIGDVDRFPDSVKESINNAKDATKNSHGIEVVFAVNYGARDEIKRAIQKMLQQKILPEEVTEAKIASFLDTKGYPDPDLLIRTGGEDRISNFLLWQLSYSEFYTTPTYWPDFTYMDLFDAILDFQKRDRRLGI